MRRTRLKRVPAMQETLSRPALGLLAAAVLAAGAIGVPAMADDATQWPFESKSPADPALGLLKTVNSVEASFSGPDKKLIEIHVDAEAPRPDYSNLTLVPRPGKLNDKVFAFDVRGRPPQHPSEEEKPRTVTLDKTYRGAPVGAVNVVEIYATDNCIAFSLPEQKRVECTPRIPQDEKVQDEQM